MAPFQTRLSRRVTTIGSSALESQSVAARHEARPYRPTTATRSPMESAQAERPEVVVSARSVVDGSRMRFGVGFEAAGYRLHLLYSDRPRNDPESDGDHVDSSVEATSNQWGGCVRPACSHVSHTGSQIPPWTIRDGFRLGSTSGRRSGALGLATSGCPTSAQPCRGRTWARDTVRFPGGNPQCPRLRPGRRSVRSPPPRSTVISALVLVVHRPGPRRRRRRGRSHGQRRGLGRRLSSGLHVEGGTTPP